MKIGQNLQFLRRLRGGMTQEELAEKMDVSRQTVSKWETEQAYPEMEKLLALCELFSCTLDELVRGDMAVAGSENYSDMRVEIVPPMRYIRYAVISTEPEEDAKAHVRAWAQQLGIAQPEIIGWDFPHASQQQINVFNMHGYAAALVLPEGVDPGPGAEIVQQPQQRYAAITIRDPFDAPFETIPGAYKMLLTYMQAGNQPPKNENGALECFEKEYEIDGVQYMDVYMLY